MKSKCLKSKVRGQRGNALLFGIVIAVTIIAVAVPVVIFSANFTSYLIARSQAKHLALEAARVVDQHKYWLNLPRPDYREREEPRAMDNARIAVRRMAQVFGFDNADPRFSFTREGNIEKTTCTLEVNIGRKIPFRTTVFGYDLGNFYPQKLKLEGTTEHDVQNGAYAVMHMDCPVAPNNQPNGIIHAPGDGPPQNRGVAVVPSFGFWHHVPPDHGVLGPYATLGGFQGTAHIKEVRQFAAFNLAGFITRRDLLRVLRPELNLIPQPAPFPPKQIFTVEAPSPQGVSPAGQYLTTGFLQPSSYNELPE